MSEDDRVTDDVPPKLCKRCGNTFPATAEYFYRDSRRGLQRFCKSCDNAIRHTNKEKKKSSKVHQNGHSQKSTPIKKLVVLTVGSIEECGSCGTTKGNIIGDVDEVTHKKYGYLCMKCYKLVHDFGGDPNRMRKALCYVEKTRFKRVAHKKSPTLPVKG